MNEPITDSENFDPIGKHTLEIISKASQFNRWMYSEIKPFLKGEILEIGSGIGNISQYIIKAGYTITLSDYDPGYYNHLRHVFSNMPNVKNVLQIDLLHSDFKNHYLHLKEKFDTVFLLNVIEHLKNDSKAIANCRFILKPDGRFIVLAPAYNWLYCRLDKELGHYRRYTLKKMKLVVEKEGFEIINDRYFNLLGVFGWFLFGKIFRKKMLGNEMNSFNRLVPLARILDKIIFKKTGLSVIVIGKKENLKK